VRFSVEVTRIDRLDDLLSLDIRRLKGHLKSYKFLYDAIRECVTVLYPFDLALTVPPADAATCLGRFVSSGFSDLEISPVSHFCTAFELLPIIYLDAYTLTSSIPAPFLGSSSGLVGPIPIAPRLGIQNPRLVHCSRMRIISLHAFHHTHASAGNHRISVLVLVRTPFSSPHAGFSVLGRCHRYSLFSSVSPFQFFFREYMLALGFGLPHCTSLRRSLRRSRLALLYCDQVWTDRQRNRQVHWWLAIGY
jgi:Kinase associated domain 1